MAVGFLITLPLTAVTMALAYRDNYGLAGAAPATSAPQSPTAPTEPTEPPSTPTPQ